VAYQRENMASASKASIKNIGINGAEKKENQ
jgi:hypothetical protein